MSIVISNAYYITLTADPDTLTPDAPIFGYEQLATVLNITSDEANTSFPVINLVNNSTASIWKGTTTGEQLITMAIAEDDDVDYVGIARHNFNTAGIAVSIEGDTGGGFAEIVEPSIPPNDGPMIYRWAPGVYTSIRIRLAAGSVIPQAGVVFVGKLMVAERKVMVGHTPIHMGVNTRTVSGKSESGNFLGRVTIGQSTSTAVSFTNLTAAWYRSTFAPFITATRDSPFFFGWRPLTYPNESGYAWHANDPTPVNQRSNGMMSIDLQLGGIV